MTTQYSREYLLANRHKFEFPKFKLRTKVGWVEVQFAIPKEKYDAFKILELLEERATSDEQVALNSDEDNSLT